MSTPIAAANAYASLARIAGGAEAGGVQSAVMKGAAADPSFRSLVEQALSTAVAKGQEADSRAMQFAAGKADLVDVVTAVAETEVAIETLVSVRDKVISAYEEIYRMPI
jgi:flagellar hook-basal body complex protein FliE